MEEYVRVTDQFNTEYTLRLDRERVEEVYHEGWKKYVDLHHVQACLLTPVIDDLPSENVRAYVTLEGMLVRMPRVRLEGLDGADITSILTLGELLDLLNASLYQNPPIGLT